METLARMLPRDDTIARQDHAAGVSFCVVFP